jgi:hypothetical protein
MPLLRQIEQYRIHFFLSSVIEYRINVIFSKHYIIKYSLDGCFDFKILGFSNQFFIIRDIAFKIIPTAMASPCNKVVLFLFSENNFHCMS